MNIMYYNKLYSAFFIAIKYFVFKASHWQLESKDLDRLLSMREKPIKSFMVLLL